MEDAPPSRTCPPSQVVVPAVSRIRAPARSFTAAPLSAASVTDVVPAPDIAPPVQANAASTGRSPVPLSVPPDMVSCPSPGEAVEKESVPPETWSPPVPARLCTACVPVEWRTSIPAARSGMHTSSAPAGARFVLQFGPVFQALVPPPPSHWIVPGHPGASGPGSDAGADVKTAARRRG